MPLLPLTAAQGNMFPRRLKRDSKLPFPLIRLRLRPPAWNGGIFNLTGHAATFSPPAVSIRIRNESKYKTKAL